MLSVDLASLFWADKEWAIIQDERLKAELGEMYEMMENSWTLFEEVLMKNK